MWQSSWICLWKLEHAQKLVRFCVKTTLFSYYFEMWSPLSKVILFFFIILILYGGYFWVAFENFATTKGPVNDYSKSKLVVK